jgi:hypothetical protein
MRNALVRHLEDEERGVFKLLFVVLAGLELELKPTERGLKGTNRFVMAPFTLLL